MVHQDITFGIAIISYNTLDLLRECIRSLESNKVSHSSIIVIDSCSTDDTVSVIKEEYPQVYIDSLKENKGYAYAVNKAAELLKTDYMLIINADAYFPENSIDSFINEALRLPSGGVFGVQQVYADNTWQRSYGLLPSITSTIYDGLFITFFVNKYRNLLFHISGKKKPFTVEYVDGAILLIKRNVFFELNGFDESFFFYGEEADFCARMQKKTMYKPYIIPSVHIIHHRGKSSQNVGGDNEFYLRNLNKGIIRCASGYCTYNEVKTIRSLEIIFSYMKYLFFGSLFFITRHNYFRRKVIYYSLLNSIWKEMSDFIDEVWKKK